MPLPNPSGQFLRCPGSHGGVRNRIPREGARPERLAPDGKLYVIEANPNPWLVVEAEFALAAREAGRSYIELVGEIVEVALARYS